MNREQVTEAIVTLVGYALFTEAMVGLVGWYRGLLLLLGLLGLMIVVRRR